jgi:predicted MFS family arabinose efflux permease
MVVGPIAGGAIIDLTGINSVFYFGAVMTLLGAGLFTWLSRPR